jgi:hypothetical protein
MQNLHEIEAHNLLCKTFSCIVRGKDRMGQDFLRFDSPDGSSILFYHLQDCSEIVDLIDICGDLSDLENAPILQAEMVQSEMAGEEVDEIGSAYNCFSATGGIWTFYKFATIKGAVTLRWAGMSNGYYSEKVDIFESSAENIIAFLNR